MSAAEWIAQRRELLDDATEGPWSTYAAYGHRGVGTDDDEALFIETYGVTYAAHSPDADLIADARTSLPRALDALEAVLEVVRLHRREPATDGSVDEHDYVGELADEVERAIESALRADS